MKFKQTFKTLACFILMLTMTIMTAGLANAASVEFAWSPNAENVDGYRIFVRDHGQPYDYTNHAWEGAGAAGTGAHVGSLLGTVDNLSEDVTYAFVLRAYRGTFTSVNSDEIVYTIPTASQTVTIPGKPQTFTIVFK